MKPSIKMNVNGTASEVDTINEAVSILRDVGMSREKAQRLVRIACMPSTKRLVSHGEDLHIELISVPA